MKWLKYLICSAVLLSLAGCAVFRSTGRLLGDDDMVKASSEMSPRQEYYLGRSVAANLLSNQKLVTNRHVTQYVDRLGRYLALHSSRPETYRGYRFAVFSSKSASAMSAPGGYVFITTGCLAQLKDEAELAGVLASTSVCFDLSIFEMFVPLCAGGCIVLADNALELPRLQGAEGVTLVNTVPSAMAR